MHWDLWPLLYELNDVRAHSSCDHVPFGLCFGRVAPGLAVLPEAASILFGGGFPRRATLAAKTSAQRTIYHVQRELERMVVEEHQVAVALCDRGTVDGVAYWPEDAESFWREIGTT